MQFAFSLLRYRCASVCMSICTKHASVTAGCLALQGIEFASVIGDPARSPIGARAIFRPVG
jgi:hypothetical protein